MAHHHQHQLGSVRRRGPPGIPRSKSGSFRSGSVSPQSWGWEAVQESPGTESGTPNMMNTSATSLESGFLDMEGSMTSSLCSSSMNTSITSHPASNNINNNNNNSGNSSLL